MVIEDLDSHGIKCEDIGGDVPAVKISALMKKGLSFASFLFILLCSLMIF